MVSPDLKLAFILGIALAVPVWGTCTSDDKGNWSCTSTGNPDADGEALWQLLFERPFSCGATITVEPGEYYPRKLYAFPLRSQTGCGRDARTRLVSSKLAELPEGERVAVRDIDKMPRLAARSPVGALQFYDLTTNNWLVQGIAFVTSAQHKELRQYGVLAWQGTDPSASATTEDLPHDITIERCVFTTYEEITYGSIASWYLAGVDTNTWETHFRGVGLGLVLEGHNLEVLDSSFKGITGFDPTPSAAVEFDIASANAANPAVLTSPGIATKLGIAASSYCSEGCSSSCYYSGGCRLAIMRGAANTWATLNGAKYLAYASADTVRVYEGGKVYGTIEPQAYDGRGKGALTGTVQGKRALPIAPQYAIMSSRGGQGVKILNNTLEAWGMNLFLGGGNYMVTDNRAAVQGGSAWNSLILDNTANLAEGDLVSFRAPGRSSYCTRSSWGCWNGGMRVGRVTSVNGNTVAIEAYGSDGTDQATVPTIGGMARWRGYNSAHWEIRGNTILRSDEEPLELSGKGPIEIKSCEYCLIDGNIIGPNPAGNYFFTVRNQAGYDPWASITESVFSNNLVGGRNGSSPRMTLMGQDNEHTSRKNSGTRFQNNLHLEVRFPDGARSGVGTLSMTDTLAGFDGLDAGWQHNTALPRNGGPPHRLYSGSEHCTWFPNDYGRTTGTLRDNIFSYGEGILVTGCWTNILNSIYKNVLLDSMSVGTGRINGALPNNFPVARVGDVGFKGTCAWPTWEECELSPMSTFKGAASDGRDPGADIPQIKDRINRWSEKAGLLVASTVPGRVGMVNKPGAFKVAGTTASIRFRLFASTPGDGCRLELYSNPSRTALHSDTDSLSKQVCNRSGNTIDRDMVTFSLGTNQPLTAESTYYYRLIDGDRVMVGEFRTAAPSRERETPVRRGGLGGDGVLR